MTNNKPKSCNELRKAWSDHCKQNKNAYDEQFSTIPDYILELDARLSALETSAKSSKPSREVLEDQIKSLLENGWLTKEQAKTILFPPASEPKECICPNYRTVSCPVHDNNDEKIYDVKSAIMVLEGRLYETEVILDKPTACNAKQNFLTETRREEVASLKVAIEILERNSKKEDK